MSLRSLVRLLVAPSAALALATVGLTVPATAEAADTTQTRVATADWTPRPAQYAGTTLTRDIPITMSDGVKLRADLKRPTGPDGKAIETSLPVVVTITAYNKSIIGNGFGSTLAGADPDYLVKRGYAQLTVDARGTGSSEGVWHAFDAREDKDAAEVMTWAHEQPWSNGNTAMTGASYMGISQLFAAAGRPPGLKAIFPQVPGADVYRDVAVTGGAIDSGFMPLWLGLVTATGLVPPAVGASDPESGMEVLAARMRTAGEFTAPVLLGAITGQDPAYDGPFYAERSPINVIDQVDVPTFLVGGEYDLFQRGTPLLYENLRERGVPTKMILGPWDHLQGSSGDEIGRAGYGPLNELQLRWFDHYVKGLPGSNLDEIAPMTWFELGTNTWRTGGDWVGDDRSAKTFHLSGTAYNGVPGKLKTSDPMGGSSTVLPIPVQGLCSRSTSQWTAGILGQLPVTNPCLEDNRINDSLGVTFQTDRLEEPLRFQGPINARLHVSTYGDNGMLSVAVEDVAPDGTVDRLTGGWQVLSHRALDTERSRYLDGQLVQPYHPFTKEAERPMPAGRAQPVDVEIFPTGASIEPGHRLRISVQAFDVPHLSPTLPQLTGSLSPLTIHVSARHPSVLTIPTLAD